MKLRTEVKYRGPLKPIQFQRLQTYLKQNGSILRKEFEEVYFMETSIFPQIGDFETGFSRLSIKLEKDGMTLRMKAGNPSNHKRKVKLVFIRKAECQNMIFILNSLGLTHGYYRPAFREEYQLDGFQVSVKSQCIMGNHFEIELPTTLSINNSQVQKFLIQNKLTIWEKDAYQNRINENIDKVPAVKLSALSMFDEKQ